MKIKCLLVITLFTFVSTVQAEKKLINVNPLITHKIPFQNAEEGFKIAIDKYQNSMKVQLDFKNN